MARSDWHVHQRARAEHGGDLHGWRAENTGLGRLLLLRRGTYPGVLDFNWLVGWSLITLVEGSKLGGAMAQERAWR